MFSCLLPNKEYLQIFNLGANVTTANFTCSTYTSGIHYTSWCNAESNLLYEVLYVSYSCDNINI